MPPQNPFPVDISFPVVRKSARLWLLPEYSDGHMFWPEAWIWFGPFFTVAKNQDGCHRPFLSRKRAIEWVQAL